MNDSEYQCESATSDSNSESDLFGDDQNRIPQTTGKRCSYVWEHFVEVSENPKVHKCLLCDATVGNKTANLSRHLQTSHGIKGQSFYENKRSRTSRSFIWKYCSRENEKQAFCHLCKKLLYFGGGNTSNITKHLKRKHRDVIRDELLDQEGESSWLRGDSGESTSHDTKKAKTENKALKVAEMESSSEPIKKERKGASYVWNYCEKISKNMVLCKICDRTMSFHGTANVITHLQRKHKLSGSPDSEIERRNVQKLPVEFDWPENGELGAAMNEEPRRLGRSSNTSVVWKFCTRLTDETVRCRVCLKHLSYQGTSNLQRHLLRMHNIVASGRTPKPTMEKEESPPSVEFEFCQATNDPQLLKCEMCEELFEFSDDMESLISNHMVMNHGVALYKRGLDSNDDCFTNNVFGVEDVPEESNPYNEDIVAESTIEESVIWPKASHIEIEPNNEKKGLDTLYDELIEEDLEILTASDNIGELPLKNNLESDNNPTQSDNPLSPNSSVDSATAFTNNSELVTTRFTQTTTTVLAEDSPRMIELKEELVRQQTVYFNEKAGFYRMQKYLVALQAKKERMEIEMITNGNQNR